MQKVTLLGIVLLLTLHLFSQAPRIQWQQYIGGSSQETASDIIQTSDGGYITIGQSMSTDGDVTGNHPLQIGGAFDDVWVVKFNSNGVIQWKRCYGGISSDRGFSIIQDTDGNYVFIADIISNDGDVVGHTQGAYSLWVVKIGSTGNIIWQHVYGGTGNDYGRCLRKTTDGGFIVAGSTTSTDGDVATPHGGSDFWVIKLDGLGQLQWKKCYGGERNDAAYSIQLTADGGYVMVGNTTSNFGNVTGYHEIYDISIQGTIYRPDIWVVKIDASGNLQWQKTIGGYGYDYANGVDVASDGNYVLTGYTTSTDGDITVPHPSNLQSILLMKVSSSGSIVWQKNYGGLFGLQRGFSVNKTSDGGFIIGAQTEVTTPLTGSLSCASNSATDYWFLKTDANGNLLWQQTYGSSDNDFLYMVRPTNDGGYIAAGSGGWYDYDVSGFGGVNYWILKLQHAPFTPSVAVTPATVSVCPAASITFTASATFSGASPVYHWKKNGVAVGTNSATYTANGFNNNDVVVCVVTTSGGCGTGVPAQQNVTSNQAVVTVTSPAPPVLHITPGATTICAGAAASFTASVTGSITNPSFQWKVNGAVMSTTTATFTSNALKNADQLVCVLATNDPCYATISDTLNVIVTDTVSATATITASAVNICRGTAVNFSATVVNGGPTPLREWLLNGTVVATNSQNYGSSILNNGDVVRLRVTSNAACVTTPVVLSNIQTVSVTEPITISVTPASADVCANSTLQFTGVVTNALPSTILQWKRNSTTINGNGSSIYFGGVTAADAGNYTLQADNGVCGTAVSNTVPLAVRANTTSVTKDSICMGKQYLFAGNLYNTTGGYGVHLVNAAGCDSLAVLDLKVNKTISIDPIADVTTVRDVPVVINTKVSAVNPNYLWQPALYLDATNKPAVICTPAQSIQYTVTVSEGGCTDSAVVQVKVLPALAIPNAFSPNGDGINDLWQIDGLSSYADVVVEIFDRYGRRVFSSLGYKKPWNGTINGKPLPVGTYYYIITASNTARLSGWVMMLR